MALSAEYFLHEPADNVDFSEGYFDRIITLDELSEPKHWR
jgi:hypothetical protein